LAGEADVSTTTSGRGIDHGNAQRGLRFQSLHWRKSAFLLGLTALSMAYYFLLPIGAAYFQDLFKIRVCGRHPR
jgi:uncharacterized membrane protein (DUF485 family)